MGLRTFQFFLLSFHESWHKVFYAQFFAFFQFSLQLSQKNPTKNKYFESLFHTVILCWFWLELGQKLSEIKNLIS